jgi:hypothetical protein
VRGSPAQWYPRRLRTGRLLPLLLAGLLACSNAPPPAKSAQRDAGVARYRLELRHNRVSPGDAFRCYGRCQAEPTPQGYLECLGQCPGFEITADVSCAKYEVPPIAACVTVRKIPRQSEPPAGVVVLATVGAFLLVVGLSSLCASSSSQCGTVVPPFAPPY